MITQDAASSSSAGWTRRHGARRVASSPWRWPCSARMNTSAPPRNTRCGHGQVGRKRQESVILRSEKGATQASARTRKRRSSSPDDVTAMGSLAVNQARKRLYFDYRWCYRQMLQRVYSYIASRGSSHAYVAAALPVRRRFLRRTFSFAHVAQPTIRNPLLKLACNAGSPGLFTTPHLTFIRAQCR